MRGHDPRPPHATERGNAARCRPSRDGSDDEASDDNPPHGARARVSVRAHGAGASRRISSRFTVNPTCGSGVLISFRAPSEEGEDCCSSFKYLMVVGAPADCLRRAFPDADTSVSGRANGVLSPVHESPNQQRPLHGEPPLIDKGDRVTIAVAALQPCPHEYRGRGHLRRRVRDSRTHDPDDDRRFTLRVTGDGTWRSPDRKSVV